MIWLEIEVLGEGDRVGGSSVGWHPLTLGIPGAITVVPAFLELSVHQEKGTLSRLSLGRWNLSSFAIVCDDLGSHLYFVYSLERGLQALLLSAFAWILMSCVLIFFPFCLLIFLLVLIKGKTLHIPSIASLMVLSPACYSSSTGLANLKSKGSTAGQERCGAF